MEPKITRVSLDDLARAVRHRYLGAAGDEKGRILDEFIANSAYRLKYDINLDSAVESLVFHGKC
jgi:hypothetical protein